MEIDRETRKLHHVKQHGFTYRRGVPTPADIIEGGPPSLWWIPGKGLYFVARVGNKLRYL